MRLGAKAGGLLSLLHFLASTPTLPFLLSLWEPTSRACQTHLFGKKLMASKFTGGVGTAFPHALQSGAVPAACWEVTSGQRHGEQLWAASHQRPWSFTHKGLNILSLEPAEAWSTLLLGTVAKEKKLSTVVFFNHFASIVGGSISNCESCCSHRASFQLLAPIVAPLAHSWGSSSPAREQHGAKESPARWQGLTCMFLPWFPLITCRKGESLDGC